MPGELPYNRISSDIRIVVDRSVRAGQISWEPDYIENYADVVLEAGEWLTIPTDTVIRFIVPPDTREGRHYITFASVATNKEDPEDTLSTAMQIANTYYLSHAVYDRKYFNVTGRLRGLTLESGHTIGVGDRSAAGLVLADPPTSFFPATEKDGVRAGVTAHFSIISDGVRANSEILKGLSFSPKIFYVPYDSDTGELCRDEAVEADLWYNPGPYTGKPGLTLFEPEIVSTIVENKQSQLKMGFSLFIPAGLKVTVKGALTNTPQSVGFTSNDKVWLKNGVIVITFDPRVTYRIADRTVTVGYDCGPADMWSLEGYRTTSGFRKGDVLAFNLSSDIRDVFFVDHLN